MTQVIMQHAFHSGEWAPSLNARVDLQKYHAAAALMKNYFVDYRGGASSRAGTKYALQCASSASHVRLIPFQASASVGYMLEFGDQYIRFYFQGAPVLEAAIPITGISLANPCVVTVANAFTNGDIVFISQILSTTQLNNRYFEANPRTAADITLKKLRGGNQSSIGYTPFVPISGQVQRVYKIASPFLGTELAQLKFVQDVNKMYITHPAHPTQVLTLIAPTNWTIGNLPLGSSIAAPGGLAIATTLGAGVVNYSYAVSAVNSVGEESAPTAIALANVLDLRANPGTITVTWGAVAGAQSYNVYKTEVRYNAAVPAGVAYGFVGNVTGTAFIDSNIDPDFSQTPSLANNVVTANPTVPAIWDQRLMLMAPQALPNVFWGSQPGAFTNFSQTIPALPDDALVGALADNQLNSIKSAVAMPSGLIVLTDKAVWQMNGGSTGAPPSAIDLAANPQSRVGASDVPPIVANFNILYVQHKNASVRDLTYNFYANIYTGTDISVLSSHLFFGFNITEWAWAEEPFKVVWALRNDGVMLSLTYLKEQEIIGWSHHDTNGTFLSVATITENIAGNVTDAVYVIVNRAGFFTVERMDSRFWTNLGDCWCLDSALRYQGAPVNSVRGLDQFAGQNVTVLADATVYEFVPVDADGVLTLPGGVTASNILAGLAFTPQLQTLPLDLGEPTIQGARKSLDAVTVRVKDTLGLWVSTGAGDPSDLVPMKGLQIGELNEAMNAVVSGLVTADARTITDPNWDIPGQLFLNQPNPYPSTILGVIPEFDVGDDRRRG